VTFGGTQTNIRDIGLRNLNSGAAIPALAGVTNLRNLTLTFDNAPIALPSLTANGNLTATAGGTITQTGALTIGGITTLAAGINDITLTNGGNNLSTVSIISGNNVALTDANSLVFGASTVSGALNVTTNGALTQSGALNVAGTTTLAAGVNDITLNIAGNNFSTVGITSGNNVTLTDANALTLNASTVSGNFSAIAGDLTVGGPVASTGGSLNLAGVNSVTQLTNLTANGANNVTVTTMTGPITIAAAATTTSGAGAISYTAGTDVTLGSLSTGGGVNVFANGGSVLSAAGSGTNVSAGAASTLQAFNGVVGTQAAPMTVNVNPGTLSIRATTAVAGISAFLTGTVLPSNALTLLNVPPGLVCFNGCPVASSPVSGLATGLVGSTFGYLNPETIIPAFYPQPSRSVLISDITSVYMPGTLLQPSPVSLSSGSPAVQSMGPKAKARTSCEQGATASFDAHCTVR
jgi:trimeric autotransporter adhesin